jgi:hypothetical protein
MNGSRSASGQPYRQRSDDRARRHYQPGEGGRPPRCYGPAGPPPRSRSSRCRRLRRVWRRTGGRWLLVGPAWLSRPDMSCSALSFICAPPWRRLVGTSSTIGRQALSIGDPRSTLGPRPAGAATARHHPPGGVRLAQTVNPSRRDRPLPTWQPRPTRWGRHPP